MSERGRSDWVAMVAEYRASGLRQKEFCAQKGVTTHALGYWLVKLKKEALGAAGGEAKFLPVHVTAAPGRRRQNTSESVEAVLGDGVILRFGIGTDTRYLAELLAALG